MRSRHAQQGIALIVILATLFMIGAYFLYASLNLATVRVERDQTTNDALRKAKAALIAYAVADTTRPGELPCPDVNDDGQLSLGEDYGGGGACTSLIGRLPWKTLDLPDLRDDSGERLWYALSSDFRAGGAVALNSDTAYRTGNASLVVRSPSAVPASPNGVVVAVVFAPGSALQRSDGVSQSRGCTVGINCDATLKCTTSPASLTPKCNPQNYLDKESGSTEDNADLLPAANPRFVTAERSETFNDKLMPIYSDDIMVLVQRRAASELAQHLRDYYDAWANATAVSGAKGFYPYAVDLTDAATDPSVAETGKNGTYAGMLPLSQSPLVWSTASGACSGVGTATLDCNTVVICIFGLCIPSLTGRIDNVATRFADPPQAANVQVLLGLSLGGSASWTLNTAQDRLDFSYGGFVTAGTVHIRVTAPPVSSWMGSSWVTQNNWHQNTYYVLAQEFAIDGSATCGTTCITVGNTVSPNNKQAILVMTGRNLPLAATAQSSRPLVTLPTTSAQFLEGANATATPASPIYETRASTQSFNDYPMVVRP